MSDRFVAELAVALAARGDTEAVGVAVGTLVYRVSVADLREALARTTRNGVVRAPRDRFIGVSPGGNVTPGGKALEALDNVRAYLAEHADDVDPETRAVLDDIARLVGPDRT